MVKVTVLGSAGSHPGNGRACSSYLVSAGDHHLLLDCGNGVFAKMRQRADYTEVDAVLISHLHADHFHLASLRLVPGNPVLVVPRGAAKLGVVHRLLGQPLQDLNSHRACVGKRHVSIVLVQTCYGLRDRD